MPVISVNMDRKSEFQGGTVPDGTYVVEVVSIASGRSKVQQSPQLNVVMEVLEGPYKGSRVIDFIPLSEASMFRRADFFYACGVREEGEVDVDTDSYCRETEDGAPANEQGAVVTVKKSTEQGKDDEGKDRTRIRIFYSPAEEVTEGGKEEETEEGEQEQEEEVEEQVEEEAEEPEPPKKRIGRPPLKKGKPAGKPVRRVKV